MKNKTQKTNTRQTLTIVTLVILLVVVCAAFFSYNFRVARTLDGIVLVEKSESGFEKTFVDISAWTIRDLFINHQITMEVIKAGHTDGIPQVAAFNHAMDKGVESVEDFDERYGVSEGFELTIEKMRAIDKKYDFSERVEQAIDDVTDAAKELWEQINEG